MAPRRVVHCQRRAMLDFCTVSFDSTAAQDRATYVVPTEQLTVNLLTNLPVFSARLAFTFLRLSLSPGHCVSQTPSVLVEFQCLSRAIRYRIISCRELTLPRVEHITIVPYDNCCCCCCCSALTILARLSRIRVTCGCAFEVVLEFSLPSQF